MPLRSCRVTIQDLAGVAHTVEVTAESLFEAVAQGLAALRGKEWVAESGSRILPSGWIDQVGRRET
jgi:hypothetical protein